MLPLKHIKKQCLIRGETPEDYRTVEEITRRAFWNLHVPGCDEHYLAHLLRTHPDFVSALDLVVELDGAVIGNIMYTKSSLVGDDGNILQTLTFGPVSIDPEFQGMGYGRALIGHSMERAAALGCPAIIIYGNPRNYCKHGFESCKRKSVMDGEGRFPVGLLVRVLQPDALAGSVWTYRDSDAYRYPPDGFEEFEKTFAPMEKKFLWTQEEFYILSGSCFV